MRGLYPRIVYMTGTLRAQQWLKPMHCMSRFIQQAASWAVDNEKAQEPVQVLGASSASQRGGSVALRILN